MKKNIVDVLPRLPLDGKVDLTYRCNNKCLHCWLWTSQDSATRSKELSFEEIRGIADEARLMGCQTWAISGGEPMLRPDFIDIFDYLTHKAVTYSLNTNGTLITPKLARLLTRPGRKMVALYGATAVVHDQITRNPGSFEATMRGFSYLKEAGVSFIVQIVPMQANFHQHSLMLELAQSLSPYFRYGAAWLWLSECRSNLRNQAIMEQRLDPSLVIELDQPNPQNSLLIKETEDQESCGISQPSPNIIDDRVFASCISARRDFHIDPYGMMSFCYFIKDPSLRFDLRKGSFSQAWDEFIPSLADLVHGGEEYQNNCGSCSLRRHCRWCAVYAYLEHGRYSAKIEYLCRVAKEAQAYSENWKKNQLRYYQIGGVTIQVTTDFPLNDKTFADKFNHFTVEKPDVDNISIHLVSSVPNLKELRLGKEVYHRPPWAIYKQRDGWVYLAISPKTNDPVIYSVVIFSNDHEKGTIFRNKDDFTSGPLDSLTTFPSDQLLLARILANRQACILHASGIVIDGKGLLFIGHSEAGKSTMMKMLRSHGEILCDDRIIMRRWSEGFRIHGTWSHGELPDISPAEAPLQAIFYLEKTDENQLIPITNKKELLGRFLSHIIKPFVTTDWWEKTLELAGKAVNEVPAYRLLFDKSGKVADLLKEL